MILDKINGIEDLKKCSLEELKAIPDEMGELIINKVNTIGGHCGPNLGIAEATVALHYVFDSPKDKIELVQYCYKKQFEQNNRG